MKFMLVQKRQQYCQTLEKARDEIIHRLAEIPEVIQAILFGSYAAGRRDLFTDIDLIVIMESDQEVVQRTAQLYQKLQSGVDLDLLVYTPEEFERMRQRSFLHHALTTGQVIYEKKRA